MTGAPQAKKTYVIVVGSLLSINSTMGSSIPANELPALQEAFGFPDGSQSVLPATTYLIGFMLGPLVFAPLSEQYGRRLILVSTLVLYIVFTMGAALAPNWAGFLVFRFLSGTFAAPPMSVTGGSIADVFDEKVIRGKANMLWSAATLVGPLAGPVISGYTYQYSWRWGFWIAMIYSGICLVTVVLQPETLATKILRDRAAKLNKEKGSEQYLAPADQHRLGVLATLVSGIQEWLVLSLIQPTNSNLENHHYEASVFTLHGDARRLDMRLHGLCLCCFLYAPGNLPRDFPGHLRFHGR